MDKWTAIELARMIWFGIRWEIIIKINPQMVTSAAYSFYHENKYKKADNIWVALLSWAVVY